MTGWGLVGGSPGRSLLLDCGDIRLGSASDSLARRLARLERELRELVDRLCPSAAAVESSFHGANSRSALQLAHARGVVLAVLAGAGVSIAEYTPATVKKSVTGNGRAPKEQVRSMVGRLLGPEALPPGSDLSDALAVALCHAASSRHREAVARFAGGPGNRAG